MKHYPYGGSTADRTLNCQHWRKLADKMPPAQVSKAATDGTVMHKLYEDCLNDGLKYPEDYIGKKVEGVVVTDDMADMVADALELTDSLIDGLGLEYKTEITVEYNDKIGGTADFVGWNKADNVFVVGDLKTGSGHIVQAHDNSQLLFCAWLLAVRREMWLTKDTRIILFIVQPTGRRDDPLDVWETDVNTVLDFGRRFLEAVRIAEDTDALPVAGKWCKFCQGMAVCPAKTGQVAAAMRLRADSKELANLNRAMGMVEDVEDWARAVRKLAHEQLEAGVPIDGWKLVEKRATRKWSDEYAVETFFLDTPDVYTKVDKDELYSKSFLSVAQIEKLCKQKSIDFTLLEDYIVKQSSGTTIAHADDKRESIPPMKAIAAMLGTLKN